jgi:hypothetical protein
VTWPWLKNMRQPWLFVYCAVAFGGLMYFFQSESVSTAVIQGVAFAVLMSGWRELRRRWWPTSMK